jgi:uncharacterized Zn finger protein (UPF0148 family)
VSDVCPKCGAYLPSVTAGIVPHVCRRKLTKKEEEEAWIKVNLMLEREREDPLVTSLRAKLTAAEQRAGRYRGALERIATERFSVVITHAAGLAKKALREGGEG